MEAATVEEELVVEVSEVENWEGVLGEERWVVDYGEGEMKAEGNLAED